MNSEEYETTRDILCDLGNWCEMTGGEEDAAAIGSALLALDAQM